MLAVFELSGFSSNLALVALQLFGLYGFSSLLHILLLFFIPTFSCLLFAVTFRFAVCFDYCLCGACSLLSPCESFWGRLSLALHCHFSVCCLLPLPHCSLLSLWCLLLAQSLRVLLRAAFTCSSRFLFDFRYWTLHHGVAPLFVALALLCPCNFLGRSYTVWGTIHLNNVPPGFAHMQASFAFHVLFSRYKN